MSSWELLSGQQSEEAWSGGALEEHEGHEWLRFAGNVYIYTHTYEQAGASAVRAGQIHTMRTRIIVFRKNVSMDR